VFLSVPALPNRKAAIVGTSRKGCSVKGHNKTDVCVTGHLEFVRRLLFPTVNKVSKTGIVCPDVGK
jgi:hypothetical protein